MNLFIWMRRNKRLNQFAYLISRVFDPVLLIPITLVFAAWGAWTNGERFKFLTLLVFLDGVLPGFVFIHYLKNGKISGWDVRDRKERVGLFAFVVLCHFLGVVGAFLLGRFPLANYLLIFWILSVIYFAVTLFWKISVHMGVLSALATFMVLSYGKEFVWMFAALLLVAWARVQGQYHRLSQVIAGGMVPVIVIPTMFFVFGFL